MNGFQQSKEKWANVNDILKHLIPEKHLISKEHLRKVFIDNAIRDNDLNNATVIDFGIGGGHLGVLLFEKYGIKKYTGYDIDEKSIKTSKENLKQYNADFINIDEGYKIKKAKYFFSLACIQHFIDQEMLDNFLDVLNVSKCDNVILQIRHSDKTVFGNSYETQDDIIYSCRTNSGYISDKLTNYELIYQSPIQTKTKYVYIQYKKVING